MRVIDNDPLDRPIIGKMIEEGCGVGQLVDNCIYLIADPKSEMAKKAVEYMEEFKRRSPEGTYYNHYELEVVQEVELENHPLLKERVEQHGDNFLMQLASYNSEGKKRFVVARTEECQLIENISLMTYVAERVTKFDMRDLLRSLTRIRRSLQSWRRYLSGLGVSRPITVQSYRSSRSPWVLEWHLPLPRSRSKWRWRVSSPISNEWSCTTGCLTI